MNDFKKEVDMITFIKQNKIKSQLLGCSMVEDGLQWGEIHIPLLNIIANTLRICQALIYMHCMCIHIQFA